MKITASPSIVERWVSMNMNVKPFDNPKVRQALNYAVLCKVVFKDFATPATGVAPQGVDFAVQFGEWPYDPKKARELLKEAGYPNGFETTLWSAYNHTTAQKVIQFLQQFAQVGVKVKVQAFESGQRVAGRTRLGAPSASRRLQHPAEDDEHRLLPERCV